MKKFELTNETKGTYRPDGRAGGAGRGSGSLSMEHPDVTCALRTGYATFQSPENQDLPETQKEFIDDNAGLLIRWLRLGYPEVLKEFVEMHAAEYRAWLN